MEEKSNRSSFCWDMHPYLLLSDISAANRTLKNPVNDRFGRLFAFRTVELRKALLATVKDGTLIYGFSPAPNIDERNQKLRKRKSLALASTYSLIAGSGSMRAIATAPIMVEKIEKKARSLSAVRLPGIKGIIRSL